LPADLAYTVAIQDAICEISLGRLNNSNVYADDVLKMKILLGAFSGLVIFPAVAAIAGFVLGGIARAAPCHEAPDFMSGGFFGVMLVADMFGIPICIAGAAVGGVLAAIAQILKSDNKRDSGAP
jgi:hypothetical protein